MATETHRSAQGLVMFRLAATLLQVQTQAARRSVPETVASRSGLRRHNGDALMKEGTSTLTWVPRLGRKEAKVAPLLRLKNTAAH